MLIYALIGLVLIFLIGSLRAVNMGALSLVVAFILSIIIAGEKPKDLFGGFPVSLFVILVGVTFLFGIAKANGTVDWLVHLALRGVRGKTAVIPWVIFLASTLLASIGAASPAAVAIVAPIGITFALRYGLSPLMVGLMAVNGAAAGSFSPVGILGGITLGAAEHAGIHVDALFLYFSSLAFNMLLSVVTVLVFRNYGRRAPQFTGLVRNPARENHIEPATGNGGLATRTSIQTDEKVLVPRCTPERAVTTAGIVVMLAAILIFQADAGLVALTVAVVLAVLFSETGKRASSEISWNVVLLVTGIVTYISVLERLGVVETLGGMIAAIGAPLLAAFLICLVGGVVSAFASTTGILGALVPLSMPFIQSGSIGATVLLSALAISSSVVDASPFSTNGALIVANVPEELQARTYRGLLLWGAAMIATVPLGAWLLLIVIPWPIG